VQRVRSASLDEKVDVARRPLDPVEGEGEAADQCDPKAMAPGGSEHERDRANERVSGASP
jgi:hypothetical protein